MPRCWGWLWDSFLRLIYFWASLPARPFCVFFLWLAASKKELATDALLNLAAHFFLGAGILCVSVAGLRIDLLSYFLGEWLSVGPQDALIQAAVCAVTLVCLWFLRRPLLSLAAQEEIARAEGVAGRRIELLFLLVLALFISAAVQTVGLLLINTLMIMPAVIVRSWTRSPYRMMALCVPVAALILSAGLLLSLFFDLPASPAAAVFGGFLFLLSRMAKGLDSRKNRNRRKIKITTNSKE